MSAQTFIEWEPQEPSALDFSLVLPFYNEEESVVKTITDLVTVFQPDESLYEFEIVAVDNGSGDATTELLAELCHKFPQLRTVRVEVNQGYGWGILNGLKAARGSVVGYMAGDGQVAADDVRSTYHLYRDSDCDLSKVRRIVRGDGPVRATISLIFNFLFSLTAGYWERDTNASPKMFAREHLRTLDLQSKDWFLDAELMLKARRSRWRIHELEVHFLPRDGGHSYVRLYTLWEFLRNLARAAVQFRLQQRPNIQQQEDAH